MLTSFFQSDAASSVLAGMPMTTLTDFAQMRLELISLFLFGLLLSALVVKSVWNGFRKDFTSLPELNYSKAFSLVCLWGLLFVIVLTMISGARELMTPGAWVKKGNTYVLTSENDPEQKSVSDEVTNERRRLHLQLLWELLKEQDVLSQETLTEDRQQLPIPQRMWEVPATFGLEYLYVPGLSDIDDSRVLLAEPELFDNGRYILWQEGEIELIPPGEDMPFQTGGR